MAAVKTATHDGELFDLLLHKRNAFIRAEQLVDACQEPNGNYGDGRVGRFAQRLKIHLDRGWDLRIVTDWRVKTLYEIIDVSPAASPGPVGMPIAQCADWSVISAYWNVIPAIIVIDCRDGTHTRVHV